MREFKSLWYTVYKLTRGRVNRRTRERANSFPIFLSSCLPVFLFSSFSAISAQDTIHLNAVEISAERQERIKGSKTVRFDQSVLDYAVPVSLGELLSLSSSIFIKSYGEGSLATPSFRGTGASHTDVLWNGINLNSPMLGNSDFSKIPVFLADNINIAFGGGSLAETSGGLGGSISIGSQAPWNKRFFVDVTQEIASFSTYKTFVKTGGSTQNFAAQTGVFYIRSANDFTFTNNVNGNQNSFKDARKYANYEQYGLTQDLFFKINNYQIISAKIWAQHNFRKIPAPIIVSSNNGAESETDDFIHAVLDWKYSKNRSTLNISTGYSYDDMEYENLNKLQDPLSVNKVQQWMLNTEYELKDTRWHWKSGIRYDYAFANSNQYKENHDRNQVSAFSEFQYAFTSRLLASAVLREEFTDESLSPLLFSIGIDYQLLQKEQLFLKANISNNYHLPSLNDLYWNPGGNPDLQAERGYSAELGLSYKKTYAKNWHIAEEITGFAMRVKDWILWQPNPASAYWSPQNLKEVHSYGAEWVSKILYQKNKWKFDNQSSFSLTRSINKTAVYQNDLSKNKQLIYVPEILCSNQFYVYYGNWYASWMIHYTGTRYITSSNDRWLEAYTLNDVGIGRLFKIKKINLQCAFKIQNMFDVSYQSIAWQPMPGRSFALDVRIKFENR